MPPGDRFTPQHPRALLPPQRSGGGASRSAGAPDRCAAAIYIARINPFSLAAAADSHPDLPQLKQGRA